MHVQLYASSAPIVYGLWANFLAKNFLAAATSRKPRPRLQGQVLLQQPKPAWRKAEAFEKLLLYIYIYSCYQIQLLG